MESTDLIAPDGGWGWVIVLAYGLNNLIVIPIVQTFGLTYKETFDRLNMTATDTSIIINVNSAFGMALGLVNGPLLKNFGYRKISLAGATFITVGLLLTSRANSFMQFLISYGIITSMGFGLVVSSFSLALNSYFKLRKNKAFGLAMTITGLGPIFFPPLVSFLLFMYGVSGCSLIIAAISSHTIVAALLLQPVAWHMKKAVVPIVPAVLEDIVEESDEDDTAKNETLLKDKKADGSKSVESVVTFNTLEDEDDYFNKPIRRRASTITGSSVDYEVDLQNLYGFDNTFQMRPENVLPRQGVLQEIQKANKSKFLRSISQVDPPPKKPQITHSGSLDMVNVVLTPEETQGIAGRTEKGTNPTVTFNEEKIDKPSKGENKLHKTPSEENLELFHDTELDKNDEKRSFKHRMIDLFDLDLLKDPVYVSMMLGMSIAVFSEVNFSLLTPFILSDRGYSLDQIAGLMSGLAITDIVSRFMAPYLGDFLKQGPRYMYIYSLASLVILRCSLIYADTYTKMMMVFLGLGLAKGVRTVFMSLVIPSYIPLHRLASASGIQMVTNGVFLLLIGPLLGVIRDVSGSYTKCIIFINIITCTTIILWTVEKFIKEHRLSVRNRQMTKTM